MDDYELIERAWVDVNDMGNQDSVYIEIVEGEVQITVMQGQMSAAVVLPNSEVKRLRNALNRALARVAQ